MCSMSLGSILMTVHLYSDTMAARSEWNMCFVYQSQFTAISCIHSSVIGLSYASIMKAELPKMIQAINNEDIMQVREFTSVLDQRELPETMGLVIEITGTLVWLCVSVQRLCIWVLIWLA